VSSSSPLFTLDQVPRVQGALISMDPGTGYVEAMIGGYSFEQSEFNRAFQACRQPGSSFKPLVYSAAIVREEYTPATMILDTPITLRDDEIGKSWKPQNFDGGFKGEVTAREALMNSMNMPALHTMQKVGTKNVVDWAHHMGIKTQLKEELGTALGSSCVTPWELTSVYTTFARMGLRPEPVFLKRIVDRDGRVLEQHASPDDPWQTHEQKFSALYRLLEEKPQRLMNADDAYVLHYLLTQVATMGTAARAASLGHPVAGKTGTTNDSFDTWFAGYTPTLVTTVWVGYDTYEYPLSVGEQGGRTSLPIWLGYMSEALNGKDEKPWSPPANICYARVDGRNGRRSADDGPTTFVAPFKCGTEPESGPIAGGPSLDEAIDKGGI
jgi:penicillin-binding protein 1A